jgi:hypothetical protein
MENRHKQVKPHCSKCNDTDKHGWELPGEAPWKTESRRGRVGVGVEGYNSLTSQRKWLL